jgi:hypothetical protein
VKNCGNAVKWPYLAARISKSRIKICVYLTAFTHLLDSSDGTSLQNSDTEHAVVHAILIDPDLVLSAKILFNSWRFAVETVSQYFNSLTKGISTQDRELGIIGSTLSSQPHRSFAMKNKKAQACSFQEGSRLGGEFTGTIIWALFS